MEKAESSEAAVLGNSLRIFEALIRETEAGAEFFIKRPGKETEPYEIFKPESVAPAIKQ